MKHISVILLLILQQLVYAGSNSEKIGDVLSFAIPAIAYGSTYYFDDEEGRDQFYRSYGVTMVSTVLLKHSIRAKRPDNDDRDSFPSGHTSSAVSGAVFIHKRYGFYVAIPMYLGAIYTAYSRVRSNRHYPRDVWGGALLGGLSSWYFTREYKGVQITPQVNEAYQGVQIKYDF